MRSAFRRFEYVNRCKRLDRSLACAILECRNTLENRKVLIRTRCLNAATVACMQLNGPEALAIHA
ncbi:protein of unknown function [Caballeronia sp. S22]